MTRGIEAGIQLVTEFARPVVEKTRSIIEKPVYPELTQLEQSSLELVANYIAALARNETEQARIIYDILYNRYADKIYSYIYYRVGNQQDAEDLAQRTFFKALEHLSRYKVGKTPFSAWLYRIANNLVANHHRNKSRRKEVLIEDVPSIQGRPAETDDPLKILVTNENREAVLVAVSLLPAERQQLILLKFSEGLPNAEIGVIMGKSEGAIKSLLHRTILSLREDLESHR